MHKSCFFSVVYFRREGLGFLFFFTKQKNIMELLGNLFLLRPQKLGNDRGGKVSISILFLSFRLDGGFDFPISDSFGEEKGKRNQRPTFSAGN